ncbi:unnamed protein product, partial [Iphiclides podalirius]
MSNLSEIINTQNKLEESISKRFDDLQAQITNAGSSKDTVAKVAEELRNFRELIFGILSLLRQQIRECAKQVDDIDTRSRRKALIVTGLPEKNNEDCTQLLIEVFNKKLGLNDMSKSSFKVCHRLGAPSKEHHRPVLVRFTSMDSRMFVWKAKTKLKGSPIALKEFLTRVRQAVFTKARLHFGMRSVWTQGGVIFIKTACGSNYKVTTEEELVPLIVKYPKSLGKSSSKDNNSGSRS